MKTSVSLPGDSFRLVDARARALKISRSALLAKAAREFLEQGTPAADSTAAWNAAIEKGGQPGDEPAALAFRRLGDSIAVARDGTIYAGSRGTNYLYAFR